MILNLATDGIWRAFDARAIRIEITEVEVEIEDEIEIEVEIEEQ